MHKPVMFVFIPTVYGIAPDYTVKIPPLHKTWRFSFASCHDSNSNVVDSVGMRPFNWSKIAAREPLTFVWGGDIVWVAYKALFSFCPGGADQNA